MGRPFGPEWQTTSLYCLVRNLHSRKYCPRYGSGEVWRAGSPQDHPGVRIM